MRKRLRVSVARRAAEGGDPMLTSGEVARLCGVATRTLLGWLRDDPTLIPVVRTPGGHRRMHWSHVAKFLQSRESKQ